MSTEPKICWVPVSEVGEVRMGKQLSPESSRENGSHVPYLRVANVLDGWIDYSDVKSMSFDVSERKKYGLMPGDILLNEGQSLQLVGRSAIYYGGPGEYCFQNTLIRFRAGTQVLPEYAHAIFTQWLNDGTFASVAKMTTSIAHLGGDRFAKLLFPWIPVPEQRKLVEALRSLSDFRFATEEALAKRKKISDSALTWIFSCRAREDDVNVACGDVIKMSGGLPLGQADVNPTGRYPIVGSSGFAGKGDRQITGGPTVVIGRVGEGGVGSVRFVAEPAWVTDNALWVRECAPGWSLEFIALYLKWFNLRKLRSQTGQPLITQSSIKGVGIPSFGPDEQLRIVRLHGAWQDECDAYRKSIEKIRLLQKSVMRDLLSGVAGRKVSGGA
jgi:type I restriction enzyme S subunit